MIMYVAVEYDIPKTNKHLKGYLRIPNNFHHLWNSGFLNYLRNKEGVKGSIEIYPLNVPFTSDNTGKAPIQGYVNIEDIFIEALSSDEYYPPCADTDTIRRQWAQLDPTCPDFAVKER